MSARLKSLYLKNFRNYFEAEVDFSDRINLFVGANGQGKTNLIEAIHLLSIGKSFRTEHLKELIHKDAKAFFIEGIIEKDGSLHTIQVSFDGEQKKLFLNGNSYSTFQHLLGTLPSVLHTPGDLELVDGAPLIRRRFLNIHLAQKDPLYVHHLSRFWRALKQRNALLKHKQLASIECWEEEMALSAAYLQTVRGAFIQGLLAELANKAKELSNDLLEIAYLPSAPHHYLESLQKMRPREMQLGATLIGPHRDDLQFSINEKSAKEYGSEGQKRTLTSALRLAEWELFFKAEITPLFSIDDFGVQLDQTRKERLLQSLQHRGQVFLTTPELHLSHAKKSLITNGAIAKIDQPAYHR